MKHIVFSLCLSLLFNFLSAQNFTAEQKTFKSASGKKIEGQEGDLKVPENRANPNAEMISVHFVQLKSTNPNPQTPLFYLEGGPGSSCSWQAKDPDYLERWLPFLELGDVILLDQRGTGAGGQRVTFIWRDEVPENVLVSVENIRSHFNKVSKQAQADFKKRKVDLNGYTTIENARDVEQLRKALGYDKLNIFGFSYGTHLGQAYLKYHGAQVENAVLVGVEGLNQTYKLPMAMDTQFKKIANMVKTDPMVNKEVPDLIGLYKKVIKKIKATPIVLEVNSPLTRNPMKIQVGPYALNMVLRIDIGDASDLPVFPRLLYSIDQGDYSLLKWFIQKRINLVYGIQGMAATMDAASGASPSRLARIEEEKQESMFKDVVNLRLDLNWPAPDLGNDFRSPLISTTRTLFMSGTLDFNTPPYQAEKVRWGFSNSSHIIVNNAGHEQILPHPDAVPAIIRFLKGENVNDVTLSHPPLKFIPVRGDAGKLWHPSMGKRRKAN